jgi:hypothetical protein
MASIKGQGLLVGQHADFIGTANTPGWTPLSPNYAYDTVTELQSLTGGLQPAVFGVFIGIESAGSYPGTVGIDTLGLANQWLANGGILFVTLSPGNPTYGNFIDPTDWGGGDTRGVTGPGAVNLTDLFAQGNTTTYNNWVAGMERLLTFFRGLNGPCICRCYIEFNRSGPQWWAAINGTNSMTAAQFAHLWHMTTAYVASGGVSRVPVTNVLWAFNLSGGHSTAPTDFTSVYNDATYPASAWININTLDHYPPDGGGQGTYAGNGFSDSNIINQFTTSAPSTPIMYAETSSVVGSCGVANQTDPNTYVMNYIKTTYPNVVGANFWCWQEAIWQQNPGGNTANNLMINPYAITLNKLPS